MKVLKKGKIITTRKGTFVLKLAERLIKQLKPYCKKIQVAGSIRRKKKAPIDIDIVLIENQIGKIAVRMKSIQGMLTQYFVARDVQDIEYVSSMNKLKNFCEKKNMNYRERKAESIVVTRSQIELYNPNCLDFFNNFSKKDDLADCFLQALWKVNEQK